MTDAVALGLIVGLPASITAIAGLITVMKTAAKTDVILGHVNSEKTAADGKIALLRSENELLREMLTDKKATAALLAQAVATRGRETIHVQTDPTVIPPGPVEPIKVEVINDPLLISPAPTTDKPLTS